MKYIMSVLFVMMITVACRQKVISGVELENKLKETMTEDLYKHNTKAGVTFTIQEIAFYPRTKDYICEFKVNVKTAGSDTTGYMKAFITNDFQKVTRTQ